MQKKQQKQKNHILFLTGKKAVDIKYTMKIKIIPLLAIMLFVGTSGIAYAQSLGKFIIVAQIDENGFPPSGADDTIKDMHNRISRDKELDLAQAMQDADFLITIIGREENVVSGNITTAKRLTTTLSIKDGDDWKPGTRITKTSSGFWNLAAIDTLNEAKKWIKNQAKMR